MNKITLVAAASAALLACALGAQTEKPAAISGKVRVNGSSTVLHLAEAVAEEFADSQPKVDVTVGFKGTGGGFKMFTEGEIDIANASRPIKKSEADVAKTKGIEFIELPVAFDGLTIVVNKANIWASQITVEQLKKIFGSEGSAKTWKDVDPSWPADAIKIYSPGTDSGTFDYFKEVVVGKDGTIRSDISVSENDNVLVRGVEGDKNAIGFFGYSYFASNKDKLKDLLVVNPKTKKAVEPTPTTIEDGSYSPFGRPLFIYVNKTSLAKPQVAAFVNFFMDNAGRMAKEVQYVPLPAAIYDRAKANLKAGKTGSQFMDSKGNAVEGALAEIYK